MLEEYVTKQLIIEQIHFLFEVAGLETMKPDTIWCAGGAARNYVLPRSSEIGFDFDMFCANEETYNIACALLEEATGNRYEDAFTTIFKTPFGWVSIYKRKFYDNVYDVLDDFDFTIAQFALGWEDGRIVSYHTKEGMADATESLLRIHKIQRPVSALKRTHKFITQGYRPCAGFFEELTKAIKETEEPL